jgi:multicomponent Na+:H+ antiporter subunit E
MNPAAAVIVLALIWAATTGSFTGVNLLLGAAIGGLAVLLLRRVFGPPIVLRRAQKIPSVSNPMPRSRCWPILSP